MLDLIGVCAGYGRIGVLRDVSLQVGDGEMVALIGANGAGKTTTLMAVSGVLPLTSGEIRFDGERIDGRRPDEIVARGLCQVPEGRRIFPRMTVLENLDMGAFLRKDADGIRRDRDMVMDLFPILGTRRQQLAGTLSGGEQQMLAISRALMGRPRLLLLDEPSLGLSPLYVAGIFDILRRINAEGTTVFLVEQNANMALKIASRAYVMENGAVTLSGAASALLADDKVRTAYLGL